MPITPVTPPQFPNVPPASGVPAIFRSPTKPVFTAILLIQDVKTVLNNLFLGPQWGIFTKSGSMALFPDTMVSFDYRREFRIADYPVERGGFESYDKVQVPADVRVRMGCDGSTTPLDLFLLQVKNAAVSTDLFVVVTPDESYVDMNITHYDYRRVRDSGLAVLQVDLWLQEVRQSVQVQFTNTKDPVSQAQVDTGSVQPQVPTPDQTAQLPVPPIPPTSPPPPFVQPTSAGIDASSGLVRLT